MPQLPTADRDGQVEAMQSAGAHLDGVATAAVSSDSGEANRPVVFPVLGKSRSPH